MTGLIPATINHFTHALPSKEDIGKLKFYKILYDRLLPKPMEIWPWGNFDSSLRAGQMLSQFIDKLKEAGLI